MSKYIKLDDVISKIVNTPTRVITDDLTALADRQHEIIDMLSDLPTIEVSEDAISREVAMDIVVSSTAEEMVEKMRNAPSVVPSRAEGEWLACTKEGLILNEFARSLAEKWYGYKCSECGYIHKGNALRNFNYCPNCGAKMKG